MDENRCNMCPNKCNVDRIEIFGKCKTNANLKVALVSIHMYEEPVLSGTKGSGTIFFSGCNLKCIYCQNYEISDKNYGKEITIKRLAEIMLEHQQRGVHNINLVTPTIYIDKIKEAIIFAKENGLNIPIVYNSNGYETVESLRKLRGYIDIYLPDFKYADDGLGLKYSKVKDYSTYAKEAIKEMLRQQSENIYDKDGIMQKGVIVRHMILPNNIKNTKKVLDILKENFGKDICISLMAQYFPTHKAKEDKFLNRKITKKELEEAEEYLFDLGFENGFVQELSKCEEEYVPNFNLDNV